MQTRIRRFRAVPGITSIVAASVLGMAGAAMAQDQQPAGGDRTTETETRQETTTQTVRREESMTFIGRGVTGDLPRPPANVLSPEDTQRELLWYNLGRPGPG